MSEKNIKLDINVKQPETLKVDLLGGVELVTLKGKDGIDGKDGKDFTFTDFTLEQIESLKVKGDKGDKGDNGADGEDGKDGKDGVDGVNGTDGKDGRDGIDGKDGKDGSPDTAEQVKSKLLEVGLKYDELSDKPNIEVIVGGLRREIASKQSSKTVSLVELDDVDYSGLTYTGGKYILGSGGGGGTPGGSDTQLQYNNDGAFGGIASATTNGTAVTFATDGLIANNLKAATSAGFLLESNSGTDVALFGAGGGAGVTFYGGINIDGQTRLATSLTGLAKLTSGVVSTATAGTDYENPLTFSTGLTRSTNTITSDLSTGVSGGQTATGGTASGNNLTLRSTSHATKGSIIMGGTYYDEVTNRLGINNSTPYASLVVTGTSGATARMGFSYSNTYGQTYWTADFSSVSQNGNILAGYINQTSGSGSQWLSVLGNLSVQFFNNVTTSGVFYAGTGSATFPSHSYGSDSNTGHYRPSADTVAVTTGGTLRMSWSTTTETFSDGYNMTVGTTTGTKIGTATTEKIAFWNATPIVQPAGANQAALTNSTGGTYDATLVDVTTAAVADPAKINDNFTDVYTLLTEIRTALVNSGIIKGAA